MGLKAKIKEFTHGKEVKQLDDDSRKKLTTPYVKDTENFLIPTDTALTLVLPKFESDYYDSVLLILRADSESGTAAGGLIISGVDTQLDIPENNFNAGEKVWIDSLLSIKDESLWVYGLASDNYTFI